jgi:hypothetical protein
MILSHNRPEREGVEDIYISKMIPGSQLHKKIGDKLTYYLIFHLWVSCMLLILTLRFHCKPYPAHLLIVIMHIFLLLTPIIINIYTITLGTVQRTISVHGSSVNG